MFFYRHENDIICIYSNTNSSRFSEEKVKNRKYISHHVFEEKSDTTEKHFTPRTSDIYCFTQKLVFYHDAERPARSPMKDVSVKD